MTILEQFRQRQQTQELFLWAHFALLALLPLALVLTMAGLAVGDPLFPGWVEMPVLAIPTIAYGVWQQWHRPLYPFSLGFVHRSVTELSVEQRQILTIVKRPATGWIAVVVGVFLYSLFRQIYLVAPLADGIAPFPSGLRFLGIIWSLLFFFLANVTAQAGIVALRILVLSPSELQIAYNPDQIKEDFTVLGVAQRELWQFHGQDGKAQGIAPTEIPPAPVDIPETNMPETKEAEAPFHGQDDKNQGIAPTEIPPAPVDIPEASMPETKEAEVTPIKSMGDSPETSTTAIKESVIETSEEPETQETSGEATLPEIPDLVFTPEGTAPEE